MAAENHGAVSGAPSKLLFAERMRLEIEEGQRMNQAWERQRMLNDWIKKSCMPARARCRAQYLGLGAIP
jgi:hypothetical protein